MPPTPVLVKTLEVKPTPPKPTAPKVSISVVPTQKDKDSDHHSKKVTIDEPVKPEIKNDKKEKGGWLNFSWAQVLSQL